MRDNAIVIAELRGKKAECVSRIEALKGHIINLDAVIEIFTLFTPNEVALKAINKEPDKLWTARDIVDELRYAKDSRNLETTGLEGKTYMRIAHDALISLYRGNIIERIGKGQYRKVIYNTPGDKPNDTNKHKRYEASQKSKGLCIKCGELATSKTLCDYHRQKKHDSYLREKEKL